MNNGKDTTSADLWKAVSSCWETWAVGLGIVMALSGCHDDASPAPSAVSPARSWLDPEAALYRNLGGGQFAHATTQFGLAGTGRAYVGFGTGLYDLNGDNWPDWYVLNGHVLYRTGQSPFLQPSFVFQNESGRRFVDVSTQAGSYFRQRHAALGSAAADLDGDGGLELVVSGLEEPIMLLRHRNPPAAWMTISLEARGGHRLIRMFERLNIKAGQHKDAVRSHLNRLQPTAARCL